MRTAAGRVEAQSGPLPVPLDYRANVWEWMETRCPSPQTVVPDLRVGHTVSSIGIGCRGLVAHKHRYRLRCRCPALLIMKCERKQRICFRIIGADGAGRDLVRLRSEATDHPMPVIGQGFDFDDIALGDATYPHVGHIHEHHHAASKYAAVSVIERIDGRVVLIVAAQRGEPQHRRILNWLIFGSAREDKEIGATRWGIPDPLAWRYAQMKPTRMTNALVEAGEQSRKDLLDLVAYPVIVIHEIVPVDAAIRQGG